MRVGHASTVTLGQSGALIGTAPPPRVGARPKHSSALVAAASCSAGTSTWMASGAELRLAAERIAPGRAWKCRLSAASATCTVSAACSCAASGGVALFEGAALLCASPSAADRFSVPAAGALAAGGTCTPGGRCLDSGGEAAVCTTAVRGLLSRLYTTTQARSSAPPRQRCRANIILQHPTKRILDRTPLPHSVRVQRVCW